MLGHVFVAGGSSGIGAACRDLYLEKGWRVTSVARRLQEPKKHQEGCLCIRGDLADPKVAVQAVSAAQARFGLITTLVHSIGNIESPTELTAIESHRWEETMALCFGTAVHILRAIIPSLKAAGKNGSATFITSIGGVKSYPGIADYCAAKAALASLARSAALELAATGGRSNSVSPAVVRTPIFERAPFDETTAASWHKLGRIGEPEEIAELVVFLSSKGASWITGQEYLIEGGMTL
jgi:3-oxoacyl-[acyl-carrier protein] reductase